MILLKCSLIVTFLFLIFGHVTHASLVLLLCDTSKTFSLLKFSCKIICYAETQFMCTENVLGYVNI